MALTYVDVLQEVTAGGITDAYLKGSLVKPWDSVIDYVPEVSDVDVHLRCADDTVRKHIREPAVALEIAESATHRFASSNPDPMHFPLPQVKFLDELEQLEGYITPPGTIETLLGQPPTSKPRDAYAGLETVDATRFIDDARFFAEELPDQIFDRPGRFLWSLIPRISWRVSPAGPRLLTSLGMHPYDAWLCNRTEIVRAFEASGEPDLASSYAAFYLACSEGSRTRFTEWEPAHRALSAANQVFEQGLALLRTRPR